MVFSLCAMTPVEASAYDSYVQNGAGSSTITYRQQSEYSIYNNLNAEKILKNADVINNIKLADYKKWIKALKIVRD